MIWKIMKPMLAPDFRKKVHMIKESKVRDYLMEGYETYLPEETNTGAADLLGSLAWVLNHFGELGMTVKAGEHIITGSAVKTRFPKAGDKIRYEIAGASVELEVV